MKNEELRNLSPMMRQYLEIKKQYPDSFLFYRVGDFYEMFFEDALEGSRLLDLTLTGKNCGLKERAPMCGVPHHAVDTYIARMVEQGKSVAICEQLEDPKSAKGMVKRGVIRVVTPGTVTSDAILKENENNYLASAYIEKNGIGIAYCDISTGELRTTEKTDGSELREDLLNELVRIHAKEILIPKSFAEQVGEDTFSDFTGAFIHTMNDADYSERAAKESIRGQFGSLSLTALGLSGRHFSLLATGALLSYLLSTQKQTLGQLTECRFYEIGSSMSLDRATLRNLEITETLFERKVQGSLLGVLDQTKTAMGGRKLKQWLRNPLNDTKEINRRLDAVEELTSDSLRMNDLREALKNIYDFERLTGRIATGTANARDLIALRNSISGIPEIKNTLFTFTAPLLQELAEGMKDLTGLQEKIAKTIVEDPPMTISEGGLIQEGADEELDALRDSIKDAKTWISELESKEKERTGITHLKVGYNKVFGYYIEVSRSNLDLVPDDYIRKQTLVGAERYITPKLKEMENLVLNAESKINKMEYEIFTKVRSAAGESIRDIQETSRQIAVLDVLLSFSDVSLKNGYVKPVVDNGSVIQIEKGRHPVIEQTTEEGLFVANDTYLDQEKSSMLIITGPNMAGKSTYMRQTALIVLMAQAGCFVPCERAKIGAVDRIFTRIGASDNLAKGQSTFFVEMSELAYILRNATAKSLIILDEIGRGTSTYDGLSIAWATVEYLCNEKNRIRTLFATHYHELTTLEKQIPGVRNLSVDVSEENGTIVFLHKIVSGSRDRSYGIHVAKLAGVPMSLLENAREKLVNLEANSSKKALPVSGSKKVSEGEQLSLFTAVKDPVIEKLKDLDLMDVTPAEAIRILEEMKKHFSEK
ncbi:MAG: DNA mismatch repair protein MutS [Eubacteriales bacterium]|nr:DNA mismatch repair protein MutS [Eubacteriales bacterium]